MSNLSDYALALDQRDLNRYKEKLTVTVNDSDVTLPDPYNLSTDWFVDPKKLPPTEYPAIHNYLIKTPGPFTGEALEAYKSLDAYNYFLSGHISEVKQHDIGGTYGVTFVKALVEPGQRKNCAPYNPWICLNKKYGYIVCSHCTCMAGLGEVCSHVAAVLFAIDNITKCGINSQPACTSVKCIWSDYFKKNISCVTADKLDVSHPRHGQSHSPASKKRRTRASYLPMSPEEQKAALRDLTDILPNAAVLAKSASDTDSASEDEEEETHFPPLPYRLARVLGAGTLSPSDIIADAVPTAQQILNLAAATHQQANSALWKAHRKGRITASNSYRILHCSDPSSVLHHIMQYQLQDLSAIPAVKWGVDNEAKAKVEYIQAMEDIHENFVFENCGLVVSSDCPFLAASPDGLGKCECHSATLVEIKCPYKYRKTLPDDPIALSDSQYCLDQNCELKRNHKYFCQIQTQLCVTKAKSCDLVVWTPQGICITNVERDEQFITMLKSKVDDFVMEYLIPELISRKLDYLNETNVCDKSTIYCLCKRPAFGKMVACGNDECMIALFHYSCVNLKRKPRDKWFCPECSA